MELQHLKNQIDPHFLFNAFTALDSLTQTNPPLASEFIRHLSKIYRHALENKDNGVTPLATELDMLRHYIALQQIRFGDALEINIDIGTTHEDRGVAALSLQMLIDNAIKHNEIHRTILYGSACMKKTVISWYRITNRSAGSSSSPANRDCSS